MTKVVHAFLWVLTAVTLSAATGCSLSRDPERMIAKAQAHRAKGNYQAAIIELKNLLQKSPNHAEARYLLGTEYLEAGDARAAEAELRRAITLGAGIGRTLPQLGKSLLLQAKFKQVLDETDPARVPNTKDSPEILSVRGLAQLFLRQPAEARRSFDSALALKADHADALLGLARLAAVERKLDEASKLIERAVAVAPKSVEAWMMKGDLARAVADRNGALAAYKKVVELRGDQLPARLNIASLQIAENNFDEARKQVDQVRKRMPNSPMANYLQALIEFRKKNYRGARDSVQLALKVDPNHTLSMLLAGALEYEQGSQETAQVHLSNVLERLPGNLYARKLLIASLAKSGQTQRALEVLQSGLRQAPNDPALMALAGELYLQNNELGKATEHFEKAAKLDPKNAGVRTGLALSRIASGEMDHGMVDLESAVQLDSQRYQADIMLVVSHLRRESYDEALKAIAGLEKKQPNNPMTHNLKAAAYVGKKDIATARKHLERALALQPTYVTAATNLARLDIEDNKPREARRRFETILEKDKNNVQALLALANIGPRIEATQKERVDWLERARKASPGSVQPRLMLARLYAQAGDMKKAVEVAQQAQLSNPDNPEVLDTLGAMQLAAGDKNQALSTYRALAKVQPNSPVALYRLAGAQAANADPAAAGTLKKALALKPDFTDAQAALAEVEARAGHFPEAIKIAHQIQRQSPKSPLGFVLEGDVMMMQKKFPQAAKAYETAYGVGRSGFLAVKLHAAYTQSGKPQEAEARLTQWLTESPDDTGARLYAAQVSLESGQLKKAIEQYEWVLRKQPDNVVTLNNLAWAYHQVKDPRALETVERAYKLKPDSAAIGDTLGWILVEQGKTKRGIELLQKAVAAAPNSNEIRYHLAQALAQSGQKTQAITHLEQVVAAGAKFRHEAEARALLKQLRNR